MLQMCKQRLSLHHSVHGVPRCIPLKAPIDKRANCGFIHILLAEHFLATPVQRKVVCEHGQQAGTARALTTLETKNRPCFQLAINRCQELSRRGEGNVPGGNSIAHKQSNTTHFKRHTKITMALQPGPHSDSHQHRASPRNDD